MLRAVIFDRDHTLVTFDMHAIARLEARIASLAPDVPPGAAAQLWASWPGPWPRRPEEEPAFWQHFWQSLAVRHGVPAAAGALEAIGGFYHTCFVAYPDAAPALQALRRAGMRLAVLTNFELPSVATTLAHTGLDPAWFDALLSSSALGYRKPDPAAFLAAAAALDQPPAACMFVDDLPEHVAAAAALGMRAVLIDRTGAHPHHPVRVDSLLALPSLLPSGSIIN